MNRCSIQRNSFVSSEEMKNATVVCPKPRRLSRIGVNVNLPSSMRSRRWHARFIFYLFYCPFSLLLYLFDYFLNFLYNFFVLIFNSYQQEICDVKAGNELLDMILTKVCFFKNKFKT